jgi:hypothetical protein
MAFTEDLSVFFSALEFADEGLLAGQPVTGIYDDAYAYAGIGVVGATGADISYLLPTAQVPGAVYGQALVIPQGTFKVRGSIPDDPGLTRLLLEKP